MAYMSKFLAYAALAASLVLVFSVASHAQDRALTYGFEQVELADIQTAPIAINLPCP